VCFFAAALVVLMLALVAAWHWWVERWRRKNASRDAWDRIVNTPTRDDLRSTKASTEDAHWRAWERQLDIDPEQITLNRTDGEQP
jgi:hypothetical protein